MIHVALLRGINVGGKNKVAMADLRGVFANLGARDVVTYINSGNVVFAWDPGDHVALAGQIEAAIAANLGVMCRVLVRSGEDIAAIAGLIPGDWTNDTDRKTDVVYLLDGVDPEEAAASLKPRAEIDHVLYGPGAVVWMVARRDATRSGLMRLPGTALYQQATVRNVNTARKLAALVAEAGDRG